MKVSIYDELCGVWGEMLEEEEEEGAGEREGVEGGRERERSTLYKQ